MLGFENTSLIQYLIAFAVVMGLLALFAWLAPRLLGRRIGGQNLSGAKAKQPRLGIVDVYDLDRQRQLVLLRRDGVEHLLLIGGPNDVVVETGIGRAPRPQQRPQGAAQPGTDAPQAPAPAAPARPVPEPEPAAPALEPRPTVAPPSAVARDPSRVSDAALAVRAPDVVLPDAPAASPPPPRVAPPPTAPAPPPAPAAVARAPEPRPAPEPSPPEPPRPQQRRGLMDLARAATNVAPSVSPRPRATPTAPPVDAPPPPAPPPRREPSFDAPLAPSAAAPEDAAVLSDMARQLEEALKRPLPPGARPRRPAAAEGAPGAELPPAPPRPAPRPQAQEPAGSEFDFASLLRRPAGERGPAASEAPRRAPPPPPPPPPPPIGRERPGRVDAPAPRTASSAPPAPVPDAPAEPPPSIPSVADVGRAATERRAAAAAFQGFGAEEPPTSPPTSPPPEPRAPEPMPARFTVAPDEAVDARAPEPEIAADPDVDEVPSPRTEIVTAEAARRAPPPVARTPEPDAPEPDAGEPVAPETSSAQPAPVPQEVPALPEAPADEPAPVAAARAEDGHAEPAPEPELEPEPEPERQAAPDPEPAPPPPPAAKPIDPFSVEEIEAEFARLLGRSPGGDKKT